MAEQKPTTAEERAIWKQDCDEQEVVEFSRGIVVRLLADVERLQEKVWTHQQEEQHVELARLQRRRYQRDWERYDFDSERERWKVFLDAGTTLSNSVGHLIYDKVIQLEGALARWVQPDDIVFAIDAEHDHEVFQLCVERNLTHAHTFEEREDMVYPYTRLPLSQCYPGRMVAEVAAGKARDELKAAKAAAKENE